MMMMMRRRRRRRSRYRSSLSVVEFPAKPRNLPYIFIHINRTQILKVLVGKTLEQSMMEVLEEEELASLQRPLCDWLHG